MFVLPFAGNRNQDRTIQGALLRDFSSVLLWFPIPRVPRLLYTATELNEMMSCWWWNLSWTINRMTDSYQTTTADAFVGWQLNYKRHWWLWPWGCNNSTDEHREEAYNMLDDGPVNRFWNLALLMTSGRENPGWFVLAIYLSIWEYIREIGDTEPGIHSPLCCSASTCSSIPCLGQDRRTRVKWLTTRTNLCKSNSYLLGMTDEPSSLQCK